MSGIKGKTEQAEVGEEGRGSQRGIEGELEREVSGDAFKNIGRKPEHKLGQQRRGMRAKGKESRKIIVSASKRLQVNSWIWPGGLLNNVVPLKQDS